MSEEGPLTKPLLEDLRSLKSRLGVSDESLRDMLNEYLTEDHRVSHATVSRWISGNTAPSCESTVAIQAMLEDNKNKKPKIKKP